MEEIEELLDHFERGGAIVGVRGMGGIGKTALAYKLAEILKDRYPDGQLKIDLQGSNVKPLMPAEAMSQIIRSFDRTIDLLEKESELSGLYQSILNGKRVLLLLDDALDVHQVLPLLPPPTSGVLITSRKKFTLPGMKVKDLDVLKPSDAIDLLIAITERIGNHAKELAQLCGYLPLALRAAGNLLANTPNLDPAQYVEELRSERTRLERLGLDGIERDMDASFNLSYHRLPIDTARVFRTISVFPADFDDKAEEVICKDKDHRHLNELIRWNLVEFQSPREICRYRLHDLIRVFAATRLETEDGEKAQLAIQLKHAEYYKNVLSAAEDFYKQGDEGVLAGLKQFDLEWANIQAGQKWAENAVISKAGRRGPEEDLALCLASSYPKNGVYVLNLRLHPRERVRWFETGLAAARQLKDRGIEGSHLGNLGAAYHSLGEYRKAIEFQEKHLAVAKEIGDQLGEGTALGNLGRTYGRLGEYYKAIEFLEKHLAIAREIGDRRGECQSLGNMGYTYYSLGEYRKAIEFQEKHLAIAREIGDRREEGQSLHSLGLAYYRLGEYNKAIEFQEESLAIAMEIGDQRVEGQSLGNLGLAYYSLKEYNKAIEFQEKHLAIAREIGDRRGEGQSLGSLGLACYRLGEYNKAIEFQEESLAIAREIGDRRVEGQSLGNLGLAYYSLKEYNKAIEFQEESLAIAMEIGDQLGEGTALFHMSLALNKIGKRKEAIDCIKSAFDIHKQIESPDTDRVRQQLAEWQG